MTTRTVSIALTEQVQQQRTVIFLPSIPASLGDSLLLQEPYKVTTAANGTGSIDLPVPASGNVQYDYAFPCDTGMSRGSFYLEAGTTIALDALIELGGDPTPSVQSYIDAYVDAAVADKQDALVSGTNIKTINGSSVLGSGDLTVSGGVPTSRTVNGHALSADVIVTKSDIGLGSVDNTADTAKPVSTLQAAADAAAVATAEAYAVQRSNHTGTQTADTVTDGSTNKAYTATEKTKLAGIASGATANSSDATLLARANHTGTQLAATISDFAATVRSTVLTGLSLATNAAITASDTVLSALGKLQKQITDLITTVSGKQDTLVSGTNIKTINGQPITGSGDLVVSGGGASYLVYRALLSQSGTDAPVPTELENTLGGPIVWTRNDAGDYTGTLAGGFAGSVWCNNPVWQNGDDHLAMANIVKNDDDSVELLTHTVTPDNFGDFGSSYPLHLEILVYP